MATSTGPRLGCRLHPYWVSLRPFALSAAGTAEFPFGSDHFAAAVHLYSLAHFHHQGGAGSHSACSQAAALAQRTRPCGRSSFRSLPHSSSYWHSCGPSMRSSQRARTYRVDLTNRLVLDHRERSGCEPLAGRRSTALVHRCRPSLPLHTAPPFLAVIPDLGHD